MHVKFGFLTHRFVGINIQLFLFDSCFCHMTNNLCHVCDVMSGSGSRKVEGGQALFLTMKTPENPFTTSRIRSVNFFYIC